MWTSNEKNKYNVMEAADDKTKPYKILVLFSLSNTMYIEQYLVT